MKAQLYDIPVRRIDGTPTTLAPYAGKVLLLVNVASECGLTPQYEGLEKLYEKYRGQGFEVLGFPANEFGAQEPGTNTEIQQFCRSKFGVQFPMFEKVVVKGHGQHPLYKYLTSTRPKASANSDEFAQRLAKHGLKQEHPGDILWNFEKFLVNRRGEVTDRFAPDVRPEDPMIAWAVESALKDAPAK